MMKQYATDFYQALTNVTSGLMLPLTTADLLTHAIVGSVLENLDMERLVREVGQAVSQRILGNNESVDDVARELHERLLLRNESTKKVVIESIYRDSEEAKHNVNIYMQASSLAEARPHLKRVCIAHRSRFGLSLTQSFFQVPGTRFTDKYLHARMASSRSSYYSSPYLPARPAEKPSPPKPAPSSPPRKVVTDFKAFGASPTASVFGTAVQSTPFSLAGGKAAFGGLRTNGRSAAFDDDDDDDDGDGRQRVELREDSITLDQVCWAYAIVSCVLTHGHSLFFAGTAYRDAKRVEKHADVSRMGVLCCCSACGACFSLCETTSMFSYYVAPWAFLTPVLSFVSRSSVWSWRATGSCHSMPTGHSPQGGFRIPAFLAFAVTNLRLSVSTVSYTLHRILPCTVHIAFASCYLLHFSLPAHCVACIFQ